MCQTFVQGCDMQHLHVLKNPRRGGAILFAPHVTQEGVALGSLSHLHKAAGPSLHAHRSLRGHTHLFCFDHEHLQQMNKMTGVGAGDWALQVLMKQSQLFPGGPHFTLIPGTRFYLLEQDRQTFSLKNQRVNVLVFADYRASVSTAQICLGVNACCHHA